MKKINLEDLEKLVSEVDYICPSSYPILFSIINAKSKDMIVSFEVGLGKCYDKTAELTNEAFGLDDELQYLAIVDNPCDDRVCVKSYLDIQNVDCMAFSEIEGMLKKKCNIDKKTIIVLHKRHTFSEYKRTITYDLLSEDVIKELKEQIEYNLANPLE